MAAADSTAPTSSTAVVSVNHTTSKSKPGKTRRSSKGRRSKHKGPAGFPSAEDLMHRLFVAISGVADQLQSNFAKDLRVILKNVFTICQSEPEDDVEEGMGSLAVTKSMTLQATEPCSRDAHSSLINTAMNSQSKQALTNALIEVYTYYVHSTVLQYLQVA